MTLYLITVHGCDDDTSVVVGLTDIEAGAVQRVAACISAASEFSCMPRMTIRLASRASDLELEAAQKEATA